MLALLVTAYGRVAYAVPTDYVLVINSYTESSEWSNKFIVPIYTECFENNLVESVCVEHMNMFALPGSREMDSFIQFLFNKYSIAPPRAIVYLGDAAWGLFSAEIRKHWSDIPSVLCAEHEFTGPKKYLYDRLAIPDDERISLEEDGAGSPLHVVYTPVYLKENIELIRRLLPQIETVILLSDDRYQSRELRKELHELSETDFPDIKFRYPTPDIISIDSLINVAHMQRPHTAMLFFSWWVKSPIIGSQISARFTQAVGKNFTLPIFNLGSEGLPLLGGCFENRESSVERMLEGLRAALNGSLTGFSIDRLEATPPPSVDYNMLSRFGISIKDCPDDTVFLNKPDNSDFMSYTLIGTIIVLAILLICLAAVAVRQRIEAGKIALLNDYMTLFNWMPIGYSRQRIILDADGKAADIENISPNPEYINTFGPFRFGSERLQPDWDYVMGLYNELLKGKNVVSTLYYDEKVNRHIHIVIHPSRVPGHAELFCSDITALAETQDKLQVVNDKLSMALEVANTLAWQWNIVTNSITYDTHHRFTIPGASIISDGRQMIIDVDRYYHNIHPDDVDRIRNAYNDLIAGRCDKVREEYRLLLNGANGEHAWVDARATVYKRDEQGNALSLIGSSLIVTRRKKLEQELIASKTKAEEANRLKSAFLANMSHEIRTPLNAIVGFSAIMATSESQEERDEYAHIIKTNNDLLLQLIGDIIDLSKIESGTLEFNYSDNDLDLLFHEIEVAARTRNTNPAVQINYIAECPDCCASIERNRLMQVVTNLINNAMKFTKSGSIDFGYRIEGDRLYGYVKDTGMGIPEAQVANIFGRFVKLNSFIQGSGLGLAISNSLVENMGGRMGVESKEGEGSKFWFEIPYIKADCE